MSLLNGRELFEIGSNSLTRTDCRERIKMGGGGGREGRRRQRVSLVKVNTVLQPRGISSVGGHAVKTRTSFLEELPGSRSHSLSFSLLSLTDGLDWAFEVAGSLELELVSHGVYLEAVQSWDKLVGRPLGPVLWVHHEEHVGEARAKVGPVRVVVPR